MNTPATSAGSAPSDTGPAAASGEPAAASGEPAAIVMLLFASAREAAGTASADFTAGTVSEVLEQARARFGDAFGDVLDGSRVWVNGEPASGPETLADGDEVAVLPPVSGG